jgi:hypothetical protein
MLAVEFHRFVEVGRKKEKIQKGQFVALIGCSGNTYRNWRDGKHHPEFSFAMQALRLIGFTDDAAKSYLEKLHETHNVTFMPHDGRRADRPSQTQSTLFEQFPRPLHASFGPAALLDARFGIAPFVADQDTEDALDLWVGRDNSFLLRLEYGPGGVGKTRRWLEYCAARQQAGLYGVISRRLGTDLSEGAFSSLAAQRDVRVVVIDYAESQLELVVSLIHAAAVLKGGRTRIILLARNAADWWRRLKRHDALVQELLHIGTVTEVRAETMSIPVRRRREALVGAMKAYADRLGVSLPSDEPNASSAGSAIELQMVALAAVTEITHDDLVASVLDRERRFWDKMATERVSATLLEALAAAVYQTDGVDTPQRAKALLSGTGMFQDLAAHEMSKLFDLYRTLYPGGQFLNPIQPDLIGERLIEDLDAW